MYRGFVQRKSRSSFNFKYVPQLAKKTAKDGHRNAKGNENASLKSNFYPAWLVAATAMGPIELVFLFVFVAACCILVGGGVNSILWVYSKGSVAISKLGEGL